LRGAGAGEKEKKLPDIVPITGEIWYSERGSQLILRFYVGSRARTISLNFY